MVKLNPFRREKGEADSSMPVEAEALRGRFRLENWRASAEGRFDSPVILPPTEPVHNGNGNGTQGGPAPNGAAAEDPVDTMLRELSVLSQGMGGQKTNYPITPENRIAISEFVNYARWARRNCKTSNLGRKFLEDELLTLGDEIFDRSTGDIEPKVVYGMKPWIFPGAPPNQLPGGADRDTEAKNKKAP